MSKLNYIRTEDLDEIINYLNISEYLNFEELNKKDNYVLYRKYLTHSDLVNIGKADKREGNYFEDYILYYESVNDLKKISRKLPIAHQSNISMPQDFYKELGLKGIKLNNRWVNIASEYNCLIPRSIDKDFNLNIIENISNKQGKSSYKPSDKRKIDFKLACKYSDEKYYNVDSMSIAAHGIGVKSDKVFYCLRSLMFRGDVLNLLINKTSKTIYLVPERNEKFYYVTNEGEQNHSELPIYKKYSLEKKKELIDYFINLDELNRLENTSQSNDSLEVIQNHLQELKRRINIYESKNNFPNYRWFQKQWKEAIIKSVALQLNSKNILRCAISGVTTDNRSLEYLFIASHIKSYACCVAEGKWDEAFDPNNGLILISNVDKLFDQHDITIKQNGDLHLSKVSKCLLGYKTILPKPKVSEFYMSNDRKKYLILHEKNFRDKHHL